MLFFGVFFWGWGYVLKNTLSLRKEGGILGGNFGVKVRGYMVIWLGFYEELLVI